MQFDFNNLSSFPNSQRHLNFTANVYRIVHEKRHRETLRLYTCTAIIFWIRRHRLGEISGKSQACCSQHSQTKSQLYIHVFPNTHNKPEQVGHLTRNTLKGISNYFPYHARGMFARLSRFSQHRKCMDDAILHGKLFGNSLIINTTVQQQLTLLKH
jgi:hypothetical protein